MLIQKRFGCPARRLYQTFVDAGSQRGPDFLCPFHHATPQDSRLPPVAQTLHRKQFSLTVLSRYSALPTRPRAFTESLESLANQHNCAR